MYVVYFLIFLGVSDSHPGMTTKVGEYATYNECVVAKYKQKFFQYYGCVDLVVNKETEPLTRVETFDVT